MDSRSEVAEIVPETPVEEALAAAAERIVQVVSEDMPYTASRFNLLSLLVLYDFGVASLPPNLLERWRINFAIAADAKGIWAASKDGKVVALAAFWRTKNAVVDIAKTFPTPHAEGNVAYVGWFWRSGSKPLAKALQRHILSTMEGIEFIAWHDTRKRGRGRPRNRLWVMDVPEQRPSLSKMFFPRSL